MLLPAPYSISTIPPPSLPPASIRPGQKITICLSHAHTANRALFLSEPQKAALATINPLKPPTTFYLRIQKL